jgi:hypothetical protein
VDERTLLLRKNFSMATLEGCAASAVMKKKSATTPAGNSLVIEFIYAPSFVGASTALVELILNIPNRSIINVNSIFKPPISLLIVL